MNENMECPICGKNLMQMTVVFLATEILSAQIVLKKKKIMMIHQKTKTNKK